MVGITEESVAELGFALLKRAYTTIREDVFQAIRRAYDVETNAIAKDYLKAIIDSSRISKKRQNCICQDTGIPQFYVTIGSKARVKGDLRRALTMATERATKELPTRPNVMHPLTGYNPGTNTGWGIPWCWYDFLPEADYIEIMAAPRGGGGSMVALLRPVEWGQVPPPYTEYIKKGLAHYLIEAVPSGCPPAVVGIGIGGYQDMALYLAQRAVFRRPLGSHNPDPEVARLEDELLQIINKSGWGATLYGGDTTALAVHVDYIGAYFLSPAKAIAVSHICWPVPSAVARIYNDGQVEHLT